ncbi:MAG: hypothetical protein KC656_22430, partial [Myxococcales bacterium]|nr:hypothetical protein [Myxococcales bacterium]
VPAHLSLTVDDPDAGFIWVDEDGRAPLGGTVEAGVLSLDLPTLGFRTSALQARGAPPLGPGDGRIAAAPIDCDTVLASIPAAYQRVKATGSPDDVAQFLTNVVTIKEHCDAERTLTTIAQYCTDYQEAVIQAVDGRASADDQLATIIGPLVAAHAAVLSSGGSCDVSTFDATMLAKIAEHVEALRARYASTAFADELDTHLDHFEEVIRYEGNCQLAGIDTASCGPLVRGLYPDVLDSLRTSAYAECRATRNAQALEAIYTDDRDPGLLAEPADPFFRFARYTNAALQDDILQCAAEVELTVTDDDEGVPIDLPEQARTLGGGPTPGNADRETTIAVPADGSITFGGRFPAPPCPVDDPAQDALVWRVAGTEVARAPRSGQGYNITSSPVVVQVSHLLEAAGLPAGGGSFDVEVAREGTGCPVYTTPNPLYTIHMGVGEPLLTVVATTSSSVQHNVVVSADCELDDDESDVFMTTLPERTPLPVDLVAGSSHATATLVGFDTLQMVGSWAALGTVSDTCADGEVYTASDYASVTLYVEVVPLQDVVFTEVLWEGEVTFVRCDASFCGGIGSGDVLAADQVHTVSFSGVGYGTSGSVTFIGRFAPAP